jgi:phosphoribosyl-ATP pyrophosphohydrolase/phosphoribosyl-AMP cyclohydrolase
MIDVTSLDFAKGSGLVTVVAQDVRSGAVLMVAFADRTAVERTVASGELHLFSRTRGAWHKGATSGHVLRVRDLVADCDGDTLLARVEAAGPACHTGATTCFGAVHGDALSTLDATIAERTSSPADASYTQRLLGDRNLRLKKLGEEASELVTACADGDATRATQEAADLIYHALVALRAAGGTLDGVRATLHARAQSRTPARARTPSAETD